MTRHDSGVLAGHNHDEQRFESSSIGYLVLDARLQVLRVNTAASTALCLSKSTLIGQSLLQFCHEDGHPGLLRALQTAQHAAGPATKCDIRLRDREHPPNGERRSDNECHLRLAISAMPDRAAEWLVVLTGIAERRRSVEVLERLNCELEAQVAARTAELADCNRMLEAEMSHRGKSEQQRRELEARLHDAGRFESLGLLAGGIAHDFNNLLVAVLGNAELLLLSPQLPDTLREPLASITGACHQTSALTRQLLTFAGQGKMSTTAVSLPKIVAENLQLLRTRISLGIQIQTQITADVPEIQADRSQVHQLVMNLVTNAIEALEGSGALLIKTQVRDLDARALTDFQHHTAAVAGRFVVLTVDDSGPGIDPKITQRVFEPFYSTKLTGRGVGLASVLATVQAHRGALKLRSQLGIGTSFEIAFPVVESPHASERPRRNQVPDWKGSGPVLLIDDDDAVRRMLKKLLTVLGFDVTEANSGAAGLDLVRTSEHGFRLVMLDWSMPGISGGDVLQTLRVVEPDLPVILVSGYGTEDLGHHDTHVITLQKPMTLAQLTNAARMLLESASAAALAIDA